jgi:hypothetical protein
MPEEDAEPEASGFADWRADPADMLQVVDQQLAVFGLEVVLISTGSDYLWREALRMEPAKIRDVAGSCST